MSRTYFDLVKDCLVEMFYEEPQTWADTDTTEGIKVKRLLNQVLDTIVMGEQTAWKFREKYYYLYLVEGVRSYPMVDGFIQSMRYHDDPIQLYYNDRYITLPMDSTGMPICYWVYDGNINFFPVPNKDMSGDRIDIRYLTNCCAVDKYNVPKYRMECEDDEPIIPEKYRDILIYGVCKDFRRSLNDSASVYYAKKYQEAYKALLSEQRLSEDYPNGLDIGPYTPTLQEAIMNVFTNPRVFGGDTSPGGNI